MRVVPLRKSFPDLPQIKNPFIPPALCKGTKGNISAVPPFYTKARGGRFRWLTISTLMLAIGMLLHLVSPSVAGFTPNWMIATYVVILNGGTEWAKKPAT